MRKSIQATTGIFVLGLGTLLGGLVESGGENEVPSKHEEAGLNLCAGGVTSDLDVEFASTHASTGPAGERVGLRVRLTNNAKQSATAAIGLEFVDDRGVPILNPMRPANVRLVAGTSLDAAEFETPEGLADGFYMARATVASIGGVEDAAVRHIYFEIRQGQVSEVDVTDYMARSDANKGQWL